MNYWLNLFTGETWEQFRKAGGNISGFRKARQATVDHVQPGDILLCYLTGVMRWVGALEVIGKTNDTRPIWEDDFPVRLAVKPIIILTPEQGLSMDDLEGHVDFYRNRQDKGKFKGFLRASPARFQRTEDGQFILSLLQEAERNPVIRPIDPRKLAQKPLFPAENKVGRVIVETLVSVPESEDLPAAAPPEPQQIEAGNEPRGSAHTEIQYKLLTLGAEMGLDVWVARNDRSRTCQGKKLGALPHMLEDLPTQFNEATQRTIELIDVLWLKGNSIVAAFEVENTTSIYSGLLRMSDLLALQPNLDIRLYLVAPDERRDKVEQEIRRPTFQLRQKPLQKLCGFLSYSKLLKKIEGIGQLGLASSLSPDFLVQTAEYFN